jgi:hypothetical protein
MLKGCMAAMGIAASLFVQDAAAGTLKLLGTQVELPFEYKVLTHTEGFESNYGLRSYDSYELEIASGDARGRKVAVGTEYYAPSRIEAGVVQNWVRGEAEKAAAKAENRSVQPLEIDGFGFNLIDGPVDSKEYPQRMGLVGAINGALFRVSIFATDDKPLSPQLAGMLKAIRVDYAGLLKLKGRFEEEGKGATGDGWMETPLGRLQLGSGVSSTLITSSSKHDGAGQPLFRRRSFGLHKTGFWTIQNLALSVSCGKDDPKEFDDYLQMTAQQQDKNAKDRFTNVSAPIPALFASLQGQAATADGPLINGVRHSAVIRWGSRQAGNMYLAQVERLNGSPIETALAKQLAGAAAQCRTELPFGAASQLAGSPPPPAPPAPPPPAPPAPVGGRR